VLGNVEAQVIGRLEKLVVGEQMPDLTIILDVDPTIGLARATKRRCLEGQLILDFEDTSNDVYFIVAGAVRILVRTPNGKVKQQKCSSLSSRHNTTKRSPPSNARSNSCGQRRGQMRGFRNSRTRSAIWTS